MSLQKITIVISVFLLIVVIAFIVYNKNSENNICKPCATCATPPSTILYPTVSGQYYIQAKITGLYLNMDGSLVKDPKDATLFGWDSQTNRLSSYIGGVEYDAVVTDCGIVIVQTAQNLILYLGSTLTGKKYDPSKMVIPDKVLVAPPLYLNMYDPQIISAYAQFVTIPEK